MRRSKRRMIATGIAAVAVLTCLWPAAAHALTLPSISIGLTEADSPRKVSVLVEILLLFTVLSIAPAILLMMTSFTRIVVAFSFLKHAMGTQQMPPNQVLVGLSLFLTLFVMTPVLSDMNQKAVQPYLAEEITLEQALERGMKPLRDFMFRQTREKDLALFLTASGHGKVANRDEVPTSVLVPAFVISELKTAFEIGFILFLPFLIIDMVVSSVLLSMGMMMLPPIMISLPFKLLLFVLVDGWNLVVGSLLKSFGGV